MSDIILDFMKEKKVPITRDNYLAIAYMGNPPEELSAEEEAELPEGLQRKDSGAEPESE